jgi:hypothetical protein
MTPTAILKRINALPVDKRMKIVEKVLRTIRLENPQKNPNNPSPSGDPWYDDPRNIAIVMEGIQSAKEEKEKGIVLKSKEDIKEFFANL